MSVISSTPLIAAGDDGYTISRSVRLRSSASAYLNRTPASSTSRTTWTLSAWVKRGKVGAQQYLFQARIDDSAVDTNKLSFFFNTDDTLNVFSQVTAFRKTNAVFRDPSAWYHIVLVGDTSNATANNRFRLYVNNVEQTFATLNNPSSGANTAVNAATSHYLGSESGATYFDGYLTEVNFVDGQALTPSSFGETDTITGVWKPKRYAGTYGTNGFYLNFSDNSNNTAATIGKDSSGNGNNWTPNNISVTSGVTYDSMLDTPTPYADGGNGRGNYAVMNPLQTGSYVTLSNGNLTATGNTATDSGISVATMDANGQKIYFEALSNWSIGAITTTIPQSNLNNSETNSNNYGWAIRYNGSHYGITGEMQTVASFSFTNTDVMGIAIDAVNGAIYVSKNGSWLNSGDPTSGASKTGAFYKWTPSSSRGIFPILNGYNGTAGTINFGQRPFSSTPPTGFVALNTQNLPDATIKRGSDYFDIVTRAGTGASAAISSYRFAPDFVWIKARTNAYYHKLLDKVRGANKPLVSNATDAEATETQGLMSFDTSGYTLGSSSDSTVNNSGSGQTYVDWAWKESVSAGFDIVTFTNPSSGSSSFAHSLGVKPSMIIVKARSNTSNWTCTHKSLGTNMADKWINLESTAAVQTSSNIWGGEPTSSVFYCGTGIQVASATMVAYLFAEVAGFSKFGSYTGNGSTDGPMVYLGLRARWLMIKRTDSSDDWVVLDTSRNTYNVVGSSLFPNSASAETTNGYYNTDITSNGFKIRSSNTPVNANGGTYIYAAFAENPFKNSLAR